MELARLYPLSLRIAFTRRCEFVMLCGGFPLEVLDMAVPTLSFVAVGNFD